MMEHLGLKFRARLGVVRLVLAGLLFVVSAAQADEAAVQGYLVQGGELGELKRAVLAVGGQVTHEFSSIQALGTVLTDEQRQQLSRIGGVLVVREDTLQPDLEPAHG